MLTTNVLNQFVSDVSDSTVTVRGGAARIGASLAPFDGASTTFALMTALGDGTPGWQNVMLYLSMADATATGLDMTRSASPVSSSRIRTALPVMSDPNGFPLGLFLFHNDGTATELVDHRGV